MSNLIFVIYYIIDIFYILLELKVEYNFKTFINYCIAKLVKNSAVVQPTTNRRKTVKKLCSNRRKIVFQPLFNRRKINFLVLNCCLKISISKLASIGIYSLFNRCSTVVQPLFIERKSKFPNF